MTERLCWLHPYFHSRPALPPPAATWIRMLDGDWARACILCTLSNLNARRPIVTDIMPHGRPQE